MMAARQLLQQIDAEEQEALNKKTYGSVDKFVENDYRVHAPQNFV